MLDVKRLKIYSPKILVEKLKVSDGETLKIEGSSGSGKSSLLLALMGLKKFSCESFSYNGEVVKSLHAEKDDVAFISQHTITADQKVEAFIRTVLSYKKNRGVKFRPWIFEEFDKIEIMKRPLATLSGGEKQLVSISILECLSPRLVLLDEAFSAMDRATDERLWKLMEKWFKERAVIYTAHNPISLDKIKNETIEL
ncbi:MAG: hypothetical protein CMJ16_05950 [Peredibacter sp.]|nr:hypothetical protein [Peredibacter sp.]